MYQLEGSVTPSADRVEDVISVGIVADAMDPGMAGQRNRRFGISTGTLPRGDGTVVGFGSDRDIIIERLMLFLQCNSVATNIILGIKPISLTGHAGNLSTAAPFLDSNAGDSAGWFLNGSGGLIGGTQFAGMAFGPAAAATTIPIDISFGRGLFLSGGIGQLGALLTGNILTVNVVGFGCIGVTGFAIGRTATF